MTEILFRFLFQDCWNGSPQLIPVLNNPERNAEMNEQENIPISRFQWSALSSLQVGRYAEHLTTMRLLEAGFEVFTSEVDDRGIDHLVRYAPGRCLEIQVKAVRNRNLSYIEKKHLGKSEEEVEQRLKSGYCVAFLLFEEGMESNLYLIPGYDFLSPNDLLREYPADKSVGPNFAISPTKKAQPILDRYKLTNKLLAEFLNRIKQYDQTSAS